MAVLSELLTNAFAYALAHAVEIAYILQLPTLLLIYILVSKGVYERYKAKIKTDTEE